MIYSLRSELLLGNLGGDSVEFSLSFLGDGSGELLGGGILVFLDNLEFLKGLKSPSEDLSVSRLMLASKATSVLVGSEDVLEGRNTSVRLKVDLSGESSSSNVNPVRILRGKFSGNGSGGPLGEVRNLQFISLLQVRSVLLDEVGGGNVLNGEEILRCAHVSKNVCLFYIYMLFFLLSFLILDCLPAFPMLPPACHFLIIFLSLYF